ncbi:trans-sulfuration enzyme family protein [Gracilimonas amylolytica]|uniref:trans-sulfuration enzyme family protein n=1 Tax=Gracilimonas amylolytica TaxID=1749045 RepID=UPI000CD7E2FB|nr:PLP-dependent aspartate aminotransferase family protein [Gracilimonas amylolytica]
MKTKVKPTFASTAIHGGKGNKDQYGAHTSPIYQTSTFVFDDVESGAKAFRHEEGGASHVYSRLGNPTVEELERTICALETYHLDNSEQYMGMAFGSGMAAISTGIISFAYGGHIIAQNDLYGCTSQFLKEEAPGMGMTVSFTDTSDIRNIEKLLEEHPNTKLIYLESIANPTLRISDIKAIAQLAESYNAMLMVDNTFATPYHIQPLELGADIVVHSTTKYLGGHGTLIGGAMVAKKEVFEEANTFLFRKNLGGIAGPMDAWLTTNGIKTLSIRMKQHNENAMKVAEWLESHPKVDRVFYPGLSSHPQHELAKELMKNGFGGMITFELTGGFNAGVSLMNSVELCTLAVSLGAVDTLIQHPASMTHSIVDEEIKKAAGITDGLVRLSVGIEGVEDVIADLEQALENA